MHAYDRNSELNSFLAASFFAEKKLLPSHRAKYYDLSTKLVGHGACVRTLPRGRLLSWRCRLGLLQRRRLELRQLGQERRMRRPSERHHGEAEVSALM
jgi:hypothetical protein